MRGFHGSIGRHSRRTIPYPAVSTNEGLLTILDGEGQMVCSLRAMTRSLMDARRRESSPWIASPSAAPVSLAKTPSSSDFSLPPLTGVSPCAGLNRDETSYENRRPLVGLYRQVGRPAEVRTSYDWILSLTQQEPGGGVGAAVGELCGCHDRGLNRHGRLSSPHGEGLALKSAGCFTGLIPSSSPVSQQGQPCDQ